MLSRLNAPRKLPLPPVDTMPAAVRAVAEDYLRITELERAATARQSSLEEQRRAAVEADRSAYAAALRAGKGDPGTKATDTVDREMTKCRREVDAYSEAVLTARADAEAAIVTARADWLADLAEEAQDARDGYADALTELAAARTELVDARSRADWLADMPAAKVYRVAVPPVLGIRSQTGDPHSWAAVIAALRAEAATPEEPQPVPAAVAVPSLELAGAS